MSRLTFIGLLLVCLPLAEAAQRTEGLPPPPEEPDFLIDTPLALDEAFAIPVSKIASVQAVALEGDGPAALAMSRHFSMGIHANKDKSRYWLQIAAENGNDIAQYSLWFHDHESGDAQTNSRALFWLEKARANGNERAAEELKKTSQTALRADGKKQASHADMPTHEDHLQNLRRDAIAGSGNAALSVALWHMKFPDGADTDERWTRIAAENGSPAGQFNLGVIYSESKDPLDQTRARFWLLLAEKSGSPKAKEALMRLKGPALD